MKGKFPWASYGAFLAAGLTLFLLLHAARKYGIVRQYTYSIDSATGKPTGTATGVLTCQIGKPADFTKK